MKGGPGLVNKEFTAFCVIITASVKVLRIVTNLVEAPETGSEGSDSRLINQMHCFRVFMMCTGFVGHDLTHNSTTSAEMWVLNSNVLVAKFPKQLKQTSCVCSSSRHLSKAHLLEMFEDVIDDELLGLIGMDPSEWIQINHSIFEPNQWKSQGTF